ncbi:HAD-IIB family hydrolase [Rhodopirellula halodulae]|uniref:HAD-IIB family hydrolase n=1 Tax=Rhodopirellula halodulae TaxID=2894198 RepID=UPI001E37BC09|nr:HAD-IIB family hydrolase [Rhodopirellula sp. JC737]MCC9658509.1 HAD-IIB family hydrolase [Rhodopirellula sp. JC737]
MKTTIASDHSTSRSATLRSLPPKVLATDLDGTFLPLDGDEVAVEAMSQIRKHLEANDVPLVFVTGRHFDSVRDAMGEFDLPTPQWILCDVGVSIYRLTDEGDFVRESAYEAILDEVLGDVDVETHRHAIAELDDFTLQESFKQGRHKWSYYVPAEKLEACHDAVAAYLKLHELPCSIVSSIDPFNNDGLVDVLPQGASKAFALHWWCEQHQLEPEQIVFCGDSGNDTAALIAGYRAVVVGNADRKIARNVWDAHVAHGWPDRLKLATATSTGGVLEGARWFGLFDELSEVGGAADELAPTSKPGEIAWGAKLVRSNEAEFTLWAPKQQRVALEVLPGRLFRMTRDDRGFHHCHVSEVSDGTRYQYRFVRDEFADVFDAGTEALNLDMLLHALPDPASRYQPDGVHGPSAIVDTQFPFQARPESVAKSLDELIIYELHLGTFTEEGTYLAAVERLDELVDLGVTAIELMPVAACAGRWNWGYDGTHWYAPMTSFGTPEEFRRLVDAAHQRGMLMMVDVVYNHFGPEGNYWSQFGAYSSRKHSTVWGAAPNFDGKKHGDVVRRFVIDNAIMWLDEYNLDGLRVDAIHCMKDDSEKHITTQMGEELRQWESANGQRVWLIAETNVYDKIMVQPLSDGGSGFDAQWSDDFVHSMFATVRPGEQLTQRIYSAGVDLEQSLRRGFVFAGDVRGDRGREPQPVVDDAGNLVRVNTESSIICIQNHDFIGNHPTGKRLHQLTSLETQAAAVTLAMLQPSIPMLFMGEEFASENPFRFFVDFGDPRLQKAVVRGRKREYPQHDWSDGVLPTDEQAMRSSVIGAVEDGNETMRDWYKTLIAIRKGYTHDGLLDSKHLSVDVNTESGLYVLQYEMDGRALLVMVRLSSAEDSASNEEVPVADYQTLLRTGDAKAEGSGTWRLLADSMEAFGERLTEGLLPNHARIGVIEAT